MSNNVVYILYPGTRTSELEDFHTAKTLKRALLKRNIGYKFICFGDYTEEEFKRLPVPAGAVFIHVFTHLSYLKYFSIIRIISEWNTVFVNSCSAHYNVSNKIRMYDIFKQNNIPVAKSFNVNSNSIISLEECSRVISELKSPVVLKPAFGFCGKSTFLCNTSTELVDNISKLRNNPDTKNSPAIIQEYINEYTDMFIRIYCTPTFMRGYLSLSSPFEEKKFLNYNKFKFRVPFKIKPELEEYIRKCLLCLNINVCGCDILLKDGLYYLTDVNSVSNYRLLDIFYDDIDFGDEIIEYLYNQIKDQK